MNRRGNTHVREGLGEGYLTVFLTLILTVVLSFCLMLIRQVQENTGQFAAECVTDIGINSVLAEYHRELFQQYNLLFVDLSYGTPTVSYDNMVSHLESYVKKNLSAEDLFLGSFYRNATQLTLTDTGLYGALGACDMGGREIRRQAVEVMYQDMGITYLEKIMSWADETEKYGLLNRDLLQEQKDALKELENLSGMESSMLFDTEEQGGAVSFFEAGVLNLVADRESISAQKITPSNYASHRKRFTGNDSLQDTSFEDNFLEQILFQEYILSYTGQYVSPKGDSLLKYQTEYILAGLDNDPDNLKFVVGELLGIRGAANLISILQDSEKKACAEILALSITTVLGVPEAADVLAYVLETVWAMAEAVYDVSALLENSRIPLLKKPAEWHYSLEQAMSFEGPEKNTVSIQDGLSYIDYLRILMCFQNKETLSLRLADIMEMDIRKTAGNEAFRMDGCFDRFRLCLNYGSSGNRKYCIDGIYGY